MLTDKKVDKLTPRAQRYRTTDADGLFLEVMPTGRKFWRVRLRQGDAMKIHTLGEWPELSLYDARTLRDRVKAEARPKSPKDAVTFFELAEEWYTIKCAPYVSARRSEQKKRWLEMYVYPYIGDTAVKDVTPRMVLELARAVEAKGWKETPHGVVQTIGEVLRYGIVTDRAERDITADLKGALVPYKQTHHATLKTPKEIGYFLRLLWSARQSGARRPLQFLCYTFVRSSEALYATWDEFDLENAVWKIPAERMKRRHPHIVPLAPQALGIIKEGLYLRDVTKWVFPTPRNLQEPLHRMALLQYLRGMGYRRDQLTVHGLRSIASTTLYEAGWDGNAIERQLAHMDRNPVRAAYNYAEFLDVRRQLMVWYADYLDSLREGSYD